MRLENRVAIVTGASRGLGKAVAEAMAREGAVVVVAARTEEVQDERLPGTIYETANAIKTAGGRALAVRCNVADAESVNAMVQAALAEFGGVDFLVSNAAVQPPGRLATIQPRHWDLEFKVNLNGPFYCTRAVIDPMRAAGGGVIINVSSIAANAMTEGRSGHYGVTKVAVEAMTRGFAVLALKPRGGVDTPGYRFARGGVIAEGIPGPEDFAEAAVILATATPTTLTGDALFDDDVIARWGRGGTI